MRRNVAETLEGLAAELENGQATSAGFVERAFKRIDGFDFRLNSFVALDRASALAAAEVRATSVARGVKLIPGSTAFRSPSRTISTWPAFHRHGEAGRSKIIGLRRTNCQSRGCGRAGMIVVGKTNVPEFTLEGYTRNDLFGVTRNPWNTDLTPGGSSGGAAASVAAGFVPAAIGTDGGGSIRRPASHTGLVGYKPSIGRWPRADGFPAILTDFETVGSLARTVEDTLLLDADLARPRSARLALV